MNICNTDYVSELRDATEFTKNSDSVMVFTARVFKLPKGREATVGFEVLKPSTGKVVRSE